MKKKQLPEKIREQLSKAGKASWAARLKRAAQLGKNKSREDSEEFSKL